LRQTGNEALLRDLGASQNMLIHTKAPALAPKAMSKNSMLAAMEKSLKDLDLESVNCPMIRRQTAAKIHQFQVDLYYLHGPDPTTPIQETLEAVQELCASGKFKRVISNISY
jgi:aflatoxin B1 aldehyde reductase